MSCMVKTVAKVKVNISPFSSNFTSPTRTKLLTCDLG